MFHVEQGQPPRTHIAILAKAEPRCYVVDRRLLM
jgi:hypothetical protein